MQLKLAQTHLLLGEIHMEQGIVISIVRYYGLLATWEDRYVPVAALYNDKVECSSASRRKGRGERCTYIMCAS